MTPPIVVGSASRDITPDDPRGWRLGGAVAYCGLTLARLGMQPRVLVGVDAEAAEADELALMRAAGAEVQTVPLATGPVFRNRSTPGGRIQDCLEPGVPLDPVAPPAWADSATWLLVPVAGEVRDGWATVPPADAFVALGWQGLLRNLPRGGIVSRRAPEPGALVRRADLVCLSREDVEPSATIADLAALLQPPASIVLTDGPAGGTLWSLRAGGPHGARGYAAIPAATVVDPTGAGDAFLAALVAARLGHPLGGSGRRGTALRFAAAVASLTVAGPGMFGVPDLAAVTALLGRSPQGRPGPGVAGGRPDRAGGRPDRG